MVDIILKNELDPENITQKETVSDGRILHKFRHDRLDHRHSLHLHSCGDRSHRPQIRPPVE